MPRPRLSPDPLLNGCQCDHDSAIRRHDAFDERDLVDHGGVGSRHHARIEPTAAAAVCGSCANRVRRFGPGRGAGCADRARLVRCSPGHVPRRVLTDEQRTGRGPDCYRADARSSSSTTPVPEPVRHRVGGRTPRCVKPPPHARRAAGCVLGESSEQDPLSATAASTAWTDLPPGEGHARAARLRTNTTQGTDAGTPAGSARGRRARAAHMRGMGLIDPLAPAGRAQEVPRDLRSHRHRVVARGEPPMDGPIDGATEHPTDRGVAADRPETVQRYSAARNRRRLPAEPAPRPTLDQVPEVPPSPKTLSGALSTSRRVNRLRVAGLGCYPGRGASASSATAGETRTTTRPRCQPSTGSKPLAKRQPPITPAARYAADPAADPRPRGVKNLRDHRCAAGPGGASMGPHPLITRPATARRPSITAGRTAQTTPGARNRE